MVRRHRRDAGPDRGPGARGPSRRPRGRVALWAVASVALIGAALVGYGWWTYARVERVDLDLAEIRDAGPQNYLVIGSDSRDGVDEGDPNAGVMLGEDQPSGQRSDSIAILRVDPAEERIDVLSIPRDLWVTMPSGEDQRINTAFAESTQTLIDTIDQNLGIPIHHFAEVDFKGFQRLVDALGGVPVYFDAEVRDPNSGLRIREPGCHVLDGPTGLGVRPVSAPAVEGRRGVAHRRLR